MTSDYLDLLENPLPSDFASYQYKNFKQNHFPTVAETASHLKLLKAFQVYKTKIVGDYPDQFQVKNWQIFLSNAVKRFILFLTALKKYHHIDEYYQQKLPPHPFIAFYGFARQTTRIFAPSELDSYNVSQIDRTNWAKEFSVWLPPLDVVMVWHSFLLNPKTFYDICMRNNFIQFAVFPFPLLALNQCIDNNTFEYNPNAKQKRNYLQIISNLTTNQDDLVYHIDRFSMYQHLVTVYCPGCQKQLVVIPWTNDDNSGFGDPGFFARLENSSCTCSNDTIITHDGLRKRQLIADIKSELIMPGVFKYFSHIISNPKLKRMDSVKFNHILKSNLELIFARTDKNIDRDILEESLYEFINSIIPRELNKPSKLILRNYLTMNLIHATIPNSFQIWEDLVGCCLRQERFIEKMTELNWLNSPVLGEGLSQSIIRYSRFLSLLSRHGSTSILVPTLDIDLVWHTHQLSMFFYFEQFLKGSRKVIDHDDKIEEGRLDDCFQTTARLYRSTFKEDYSICFCWYCVTIRSRSTSTMRKLFKKNTDLNESNYEKHPLYLNRVGLTHISLHNAIELPSVFADAKRREVNKKYGGKQLPWKEESKVYMWGSYPGIYVIPPYFPIDPSCNGFYTNGLCCTVDNSGTINCGTGSGNGNRDSHCGTNGTSSCSSGGNCGGGGGSGGGCDGGGGGCDGGGGGGGGGDGGGGGGGCGGS